MGTLLEMGFSRFIQNGRVCLINYGPDRGKLVCVVDVIDGDKALVYGPTSGVARQVMGYKRLSLTDIKVEGVARGARKKTVDAAWAAEDIDASGLPLPGARSALHARLRQLPTTSIASRLWSPRRSSWLLCARRLPKSVGCLRIPSLKQ